jgi:uncharacterized membrane protein YczE
VLWQVNIIVRKQQLAQPHLQVNQVVHHQQEEHVGIVVEHIIQGLMLIVLCIAIKRFNWRYLLGFGVAVLYGYTLDFFLFLMGGITLNGVWMRYVLLLIGDVCTAFGVACFFHKYMPLQVYELFVAEIARVFNFDINKTKRFFDLSLLGVSILLAFTLFGDTKTFDWNTIWYSSYHSIGIGTLITTAINSPIIKYMGKLIDKTFDETPRFDRLYSVLKRS